MNSQLATRSGFLSSPKPGFLLNNLECSRTENLSAEFLSAVLSAGGRVFYGFFSGSTTTIRKTVRFPRDKSART